ncbi:MAG: PAS-domain containing protein, partial [Alphaproteobacteria bacterium]
MSAVGFALAAALCAICVAALVLDVTVVHGAEIGQLVAPVGMLAVFMAWYFHSRGAVLTEGRLVDALEDSPIGVALYDRNSRLVNCNGAFIALSAPLMAGDIRPGITHEDYLRRYAKTCAPGMEDPERWLAENLAAHRMASGARTLPLTDGRVAKIEHHRTRGGGTLTVVTDVT